MSVENQRWHILIPIKFLLVETPRKTNRKLIRNCSDKDSEKIGVKIVKIINLSVENSKKMVSRFSLSFIDNNINFMNLKSN